MSQEVTGIFTYLADINMTDIDIKGARKSNEILWKYSVKM